MLTEFGKFTRKLRIELDENMLEMAEKLNVSTAFLSSVETGKKKIPKDWFELLSNKYNLNENQQRELKEAIELSAQVIKIDFSDKSDDDKHFMLKLAKSVGMIDQTTKDKILEILNKGE